MDRQVRWVRRFVASRVATRVGIEFVLCTVIAFVLLRLIEIDRLIAVPWAVIIAGVVVIGRLIISLFVNPLNHRYLDSYIDVVLDFTSSELDLDDGPERALGFVGVVTLNGRGDDGEPTLDVFQSRDRTILAASSPEDGSPMFMSRLSDGRVLVTHDLFIPPHDLMMVNLRRRSDELGLLASHRDTLEELVAAGSRVAQSGVELVVDVLRIEQDAYWGIGPIIGAFLSVGRASRPHLLTVRIPESTVRERSILVFRRPNVSRPASQIVTRSAA